MSSLNASARRNRRMALAEQPGGSCCHYCKRQLTQDERTFDHIVPRSLGGKAIYRNLVLSCEPCNSDKGNYRAACYCATCFRAWEVFGPHDWRDLPLWFPRVPAEARA